MFIVGGCWVAGLDVCVAGALGVVGTGTGAGGVGGGGGGGGDVGGGGDLTASAHS